MPGRDGAGLGSKPGVDKKFKKLIIELNFNQKLIVRALSLMESAQTPENLESISSNHLIYSTQTPWIQPEFEWNFTREPPKPGQNPELISDQTPSHRAGAASFSPLFPLEYR